MRTRLFTAAVLLTAFVILSSQYTLAPAAERISSADPAAWPPEQDAVRAAPQNHRVIFENAEMRVISVTVKPNEREKLHHHRWPSIMVIDSLPKMVDYDKDGKEIKLPLPEKIEMPLVVRLPPQALHSIHNIDSKPFHAIRIEYKKGQMPD